MSEKLTCKMFGDPGIISELPQVIERLDHL